MKRIGCLFLSCALVLSFGGCSQTDFANIDGVMSPPKLTEEQNMIYAALEDSVGKNIRLKYPKTGDYKSAFVMQNIDDEPGEEAIVFYEIHLQRAGCQPERPCKGAGQTGWGVESSPAR